MILFRTKASRDSQFLFFLDFWEFFCREPYVILPFFSVLGFFDPLAKGVGGTKVDRIFFSILDDLWWNPFGAS